MAKMRNLMVGDFLGSLGRYQDRSLASVKKVCPGDKHYLGSHLWSLKVIDLLFNPLCFNCFLIVINRSQRTVSCSLGAFCHRRRPLGYITHTDLMVSYRGIPGGQHSSQKCSLQGKVSLRQRSRVLRGQGGEGQGDRDTHALQSQEGGGQGEQSPALGSSSVSSC